ncbi:MAG: antibiotic biosynthesis monooxygenase [Bacteroidetes bacterium]|nr:antibiotic biosynthesis monooxygenase [Bacteroidota bacterium]
MIIRIVKMTFVPEKVNAFLKVFNEAKNKILNSEGCKHVELLTDSECPGVLFTYSHWETPEHLEKYRKSELFKTTWANTKILFADKPEAWSLKAI